MRPSSFFYMSFFFKSVMILNVSKCYRANLETNITNNAEATPGKKELDIKRRER